MTRIIVAVIFVSLNLQAAVNKSEINIEKILLTKSPEKFELLKKQGPQVYSDLKKTAFDDKNRLALRWQAFMAMAKIAEKESLPEVEMALNHEDWFLRSAALKVITLLDEAKAYSASVKALNDSALVVRTQAVNNLARLKKTESADLLWKQLYSKNNYHKNQSLWIRRHIVEALAEVEGKGSEGKFIKILEDSDSTLFKPAIKGLEKITGQKLGGVTMPPVYKRHLWIKWFESKTSAKNS